MCNVRPSVPHKPPLSLRMNFVDKTHLFTHRLQTPAISLLASLGNTVSFIDNSECRVPKESCLQRVSWGGAGSGGPSAYHFLFGCLGQWPSPARSKAFDVRCSTVGRSQEFPWNNPESFRNCYIIITLLIMALSTPIPASFPLPSSTRRAGKWKTHLPGSEMGMATWHWLIKREWLSTGDFKDFHFHLLSPSSSPPSKMQMR